MRGRTLEILLQMPREWTRSPAYIRFCNYSSKIGDKRSILLVATLVLTKDRGNHINKGWVWRFLRISKVKRWWGIVRPAFWWPVLLMWARDRLLIGYEPAVSCAATRAHTELLAMGKTKRLSFSPSGVTSHGWMIDTKYYTADVCISTARLMDGEASEDAKAYASSDHCQALVLVFDLSNFSTFDVAREWAASLNLKKYEVLLCVGNKADRVPDHFGHREYRKKLQKRGESSSDPHPEFWDFGILRSEGSSLLNDEGDSLDELRSPCIEWCMEHGIEYLETCAANHLFDQCISVNGDLQGIDRIFGALSAHMWPGLILKEAKKGPSVDILAMHNDEDDSADEDSEVSIDYERLSHGSAEPWDNDEGPWTFYESAPLPGGEEEINTSAGEEPLESSLHGGNPGSTNEATPSGNRGSDEATSGVGPDTGSASPVSETVNNPSFLSSLDTPVSNGEIGDSQTLSLGEEVEHVHDNGRRDGDTESIDLEQLMLEMTQMRENARLMPDAQRREMAASLAIRMAAMFDEDDF